MEELKQQVKDLSERVQELEQEIERRRNQQLDYPLDQVSAEIVRDVTA